MFSSSAVKLRKNIKFPNWELASSVTHQFQGRNRASKIKPCVIREDLYRRKYRNHHSVIYETAKPLHGMWCFFLFGLLSHKTVNPIGCCYEQDYAERNLRGKHSSKMSFSGDGGSPHRKPISRIYGGIFI